MAWLYNHRHQLDGLKPLIEIAYWAVISHVPPEDRDDVEQEVVISLMETVKKHGNKGKNYLQTVARYEIYKYLRRKYKEAGLFYYFHGNDTEEMVSGARGFVTSIDIDARLDAIATLAALPRRLVQIGYKILDGEKLSEPDQHYWIRQKAKLRPKLNCRRYANRLSDWEKRRILQLHTKGMSMCKIARTVGRTNKAVMRVLAGSQPLSRRGWLDKMKMTAEKKNEQIRHAYFVDRKSIYQIVREFHHSRRTVRRAILEAPTERATELELKDNETQRASK